MGHTKSLSRIFKRMLGILLCIGLCQISVFAQTTGDSDKWNNHISFSNDPLASWGTPGGARWVKFVILLEPYDANVVYFQDSKAYDFHYEFAVNHLDPFIGMTTHQFNAVTLFAQNQQAILGSVLLPPLDGSPSDPASKPIFDEYGIQFVRQEAYSPEEIVDLFTKVKASIDASPDVQAFYFPTFEQQTVALANQDWFASQGVPLGSTAQWAEGNICYSQGWALGTLKFIPAEQINQAYQTGLLTPYDILLTDGIPAELPFVAGILSLVPSTPNSHVAILARTYTVPFLFLALKADAERAQQLVGHRIVYSSYDDDFSVCQLRLLDTDGLLDDAIVNQILELKQPVPLNISPMIHFGQMGISTELLHPGDVNIAGGKAANCSTLRKAIPDNSPKSMVLTFDVWNAFLDQPLTSPQRIDLLPGQHILIYADEDESQGPLHAGFRLNKAGESIALYDTDGVTLIDVIHFQAQDEDISYGRASDGSESWLAFGIPTPGTANGAGAAQSGEGLVINEFMADNSNTLEDPDEPGEAPDWIELYNAADHVVTLNGLYLTDDMNEPTKWRISSPVLGSTLREEIANRLSKYPSYPPAIIQELTSDLAVIRNLFTDPGITQFSETVRAAILDELSKPEHGFDPYAMLRFRSSTNVEDSADFTGAGLYESYSGCLADELDDEDTMCDCDPNRTSERGVFEAIRQTFASFYNDNAYLERLRRSVNENEVGMAVLVHHSFPDDIELANGVATMETDESTDNTLIHLVTQDGAVSVTNPMDGSQPEVMEIDVFSNGTIIINRGKRTQQSSLVPLGAWVMNFPDDYRALGDLLMQVYRKFGEVTGRTDYMLDLEYKKVAPGGKILPEGGLVIKQVRQLPEPNQVANRTPFLINEPTRFEVYTGEFTINGDGYDVFAHHRLKSRWTLETQNTPLDNPTLENGFYTQVTMQYLDDNEIRTLSEDVSVLPANAHGFFLDFATDSWELPDLVNPRTYHLRTTNVPTQVSESESPILTLTDFGEYATNVPFKCFRLSVDYDQPVTSLDRERSDNSLVLRLTAQNSLYMWSPPEASKDDLLLTREWTSNGVTVTTTFYFPPPPEGASSWIEFTGATGPLLRWEQTTIKGLTTEPIVLRGYFSQTYKPEHHNLVEHFLFEPRLESGLPQSILDQLQSQDIRFIHLVMDNRGEDEKMETGDQSTILTYGFDHN